MNKTREMRIQEHRKFMEDRATAYLKPLMIDILKERPEDILDYIGLWVQTKGKEIKATLKGNVPANVLQPKLDQQQINLPSQVIPDAPKPESVKQLSKAEIPLSPDIPLPPQDQLPHPAASKENLAPEPTDPKSPGASLDKPPQVKPHSNSSLSSEASKSHLEDDPDRFEKMNAKKNAHKKKMGISAEVYGNYNQLADFKPPFIEKTAEQLAQIKKTLGLSFMFKNLDEKDFEAVVGAMGVKNFGVGEFVIRQGDDGAELFIVGEGTLSCQKLFPGKEEPTFLKTYKPGEVFGELSLMYNAPRAASIFSDGDSVCFSLDRDTFNNIVKGAAVKRRNLFEEFLGKVDILTDLEPYERSKICDCLNTETFALGDFVIREGEEADRFYLIMEGTGEALKEIDGQLTKVFEYQPNTYFGELALLNNDKRKASIRVTSEKMLVASLDRNSFKRMLGPIEEILKRNSDKYAKYAGVAEVKAD